MRDEFRRYLQARASLEDPDLYLRDLTRVEARALARRVGLAPRGRPERGPVRREGRPERPRARLGPEEIGRLSREGEREEILAIPDVESLRAVAEACVRCPLHETRRNAVFGEGDPDADVLCVGEAPGAREDETGRPFVGRAGELLDRLLLAVGFRREEVYICNVLKSRPPQNRDPRAEEIEACSPYLLRQIELVDPAVIVAFGSFAARTLLDVRSSLGSLRGRPHAYGGYPVVVTYHPAALLRNPRWTRPAWDDLQLVRRILEGEGLAGVSEQLDLV